MNATTLRRATVLAAALCLSAAGQTAEYFDLPGNFRANNISGDGTVVVGTVGNTDGVAIWTVASGLRVLAGPNGASIRGGAWAASVDGSVIVGTVLYQGHQVPFRWTESDGMVILAPQGFPGAGNGYGVSADGEMVCGQGGVSGAKGFLWDAVHGLRDLVRPADDLTSGQVASAMSGDGRYAVGWQARPGGDVFLRWDTRTFEVETLTLADGSGQLLSGQVTDTNQDGQVVVGRAVGPVGGTRPVIWTSNGLEFIGPANGYARRTTADGVVVAGSSASLGGTAWLWTPGLGTVNFVDFLRDDHGLTVPGATYGQIYGVSDDGRAFCGSGSWPWYVRLAAARPADFNRDEFVDFLDLVDYTDCFEGRHLLPVSSADLNHDGITDFFDYIQFIDDFAR